MDNRIPLVNNNQISINANQWTLMKETLSDSEIKIMIHEAIEEHDIPMPMRDLTLDDATEDFSQLLQLNEQSLLKTGPTFTRYDYKYPLSNYYISQSNVGNKASDYFQQYNRWLCDSINAPSPYRSWHNRKFREGILNALFTMKFKEVNTTTLRSAIGLRKYIASQFKPSVAKFIYNAFDGKKVLDFSAGWGDRLAGFYSSNAKEYIGIDPNTRLFSKYDEQKQLYSQHTSGKIATMHNIPAEEFDFTQVHDVDVVFTSPPYFNIEKYNRDDSTQSWKRYKKLPQWLDGFLFPTLSGAWGTLKEGGYMIINISDVYSNHQVNQICDPMCEFIDSLDSAHYVGCMGMKMSKRPNSKSDKKGTFVEPMWVFGKGTIGSNLGSVLSSSDCFDELFE